MYTARSIRPIAAIASSRISRSRHAMRAAALSNVATFSLMKPVDANRASGVLVYTVVNRGNSVPTAGPDGHISLVSGWQGDVTPTDVNQTIQVPVAQTCRWQRYHGTGPGAVLGSAARYDHSRDPAGIARLRLLSSGVTRLITGSAHLSRGRDRDRRDERGRDRAASDWAFADCRTTPFPGTPDMTRVCLRGGFEAHKCTSSSTPPRIQRSSGSAWRRRAISSRSSATAPPTITARATRSRTSCASPWPSAPPNRATSSRRCPSRVQ